VTKAQTTLFDVLARQGDANAQFNLALLYADGKDCPQDYVKARYWHVKAARQGHAAAHYSLALMHHKGQGIPRNDAKSARRYRTAAQLGHQAAQFNLAVLYDQGLGVAHDLVMAYVWFFVAGAQGKKVQTLRHQSTDSIASRLSYSMSKGGLAAKGNCDRIYLKLTASQRQHAGRLADRYCARYVLPFR
jgi:TPR repeat protein